MKKWTWRVSCLPLLAELGLENEDRRRLDAVATHPNQRGSPAAKRSLLEPARARGEHDIARWPWNSMPLEKNP